MIRSVIIATGSCIPETKISNKVFLNNEFFGKDGSKVYKSNTGVLKRFREITGISERRYAKPDQRASDLGFLAAQDALQTSGIDKETLDFIIVAHNFGDVAHESNRVNLVPSLASRIKALLQIKNCDCVAYDIAFGCPGWVEGLIQANYFIRSGDAKKCMVIGTETLSRVIDPHDVDSMLYSDGGGAVILEGFDTDTKGIITHKTQTYACDHAVLLNMDHSYSPFIEQKDHMFIKMSGRKVYEFALNHVPLVVKAALDKARLSITDISKVLIHQANDKMDTAILERLFKLFGKEADEIPNDIMPMTIGWLGNSSVATIPTLLDIILKGKMENQKIEAGEKVVIASVGAGMNINAIIYQF